jgi:hypothetical protein
MKGEIALITILTDNVSQMLEFYRDVLECTVQRAFV